jgi:hypothetical protein
MSALVDRSGGETVLGLSRGVIQAAAAHRHSSVSAAAPASSSRRHRNRWRSGQDDLLQFLTQRNLARLRDDFARRADGSGLPLEVFVHVMHQCLGMYIPNSNRLDFTAQCVELFNQACIAALQLRWWRARWWWCACCVRVYVFACVCV